MQKPQWQENSILKILELIQCLKVAEHRRPQGEPYYSAGHQVLAVSRDELMKAYLDMPIEDLKEHFLDEWIDAKDRYPYYIKVTGHGKNGNYSASLMDPLNNDKLKKISSEHIELEDIGLSSIGVWAGEGRRRNKII